MVKVGLEIKVALENIEELKTSGREFIWYMKFTCTNCGECSSKWNTLSQSEEFPEEHGKGPNCHFISKCKMCSRTNSVTIMEDSIKSYTSKDEGTFKSVVIFQCRGTEPSNFWPKDGWIAKAIEGGTTFEDVDLTEGDWADYCEKIKQPVSVSDVQHRFVRVK